jgi:hypothetical protein
MKKLLAIDEGTQIDAYEFDVLGQTRFTGTMDFTPEEQAVIAAVYKSVQRPLQPCNYEHEVHITQLYTIEQARTIIRGYYNGTKEQKHDFIIFTQRCLCNEEYRKQQPLCAHALDFEPNPYGQEISDLSTLRILHATRWQCWYQIMRKQIAGVDGVIAKDRYDQEVNTPEYRQILQQAIINTLEMGRSTLQTCLERVGRECNIPLTTTA